MTSRAQAGAPGSIGGQFIATDAARQEAGQLAVGDDELADCRPTAPFGSRMGALRSGDPRALRVLARDPDPVVRYHVLRRHGDEVFPEDRARLRQDAGVARVAEVFRG